MAVRTTVDIPAALHELLRRRAEQSGTSIGALIVQAIEQAYGNHKESRRVTGPLISKRGKRGPAFPAGENPHPFVFS